MCIKLTLWITVAVGDTFYSNYGLAAISYYVPKQNNPTIVDLFT